MGIPRQASDGLLILGGGFAGGYVARLTGTGSTRTYHLYQLPLLIRKLRVVVDWTVALFFRRDIAELGGLGDRRGLRDG